MDKNKKKFLIISTYDSGGAGIATFRITKYLSQAGHEVALVVKDKKKLDKEVVQVKVKYFRQKINQLKKKFRTIDHKTDPDFYFFDIDESYSYSSADEILQSISFTPDIIIAGWMSNFINYKTLSKLKEKTQANVFVWSVDRAPFTGGCHYFGSCSGYQSECKLCPAIRSINKKHLANRNFKLKERSIRQANIKIIAGSEWDIMIAANSSLFRSQNKVYNTNSCVDTEIYNDYKKGIAKQVFGIPKEKKVIFAGATYINEKRKGIAYFIEGLNHLWNQLSPSERKEVLVVIIGNSSNQSSFISHVPFEVKELGFIHDEMLLSLLYQACDIFVCSSLDDSGPMMVSEALACGTPVVGFEMGVVSNIVIHEVNGYKAILGDGKDLGEGMLKILRLSESEYRSYCKYAIKQVKQFSSREYFLSMVEEMIRDTNWSK